MIQLQILQDKQKEQHNMQKLLNEKNIQDCVKLNDDKHYHSII